LRGEHAVTPFAPTLAQTAEHAERLDRIGVAKRAAERRIRALDSNNTKDFNEE
jgi:hypothetical protein